MHPGPSLRCFPAPGLTRGMCKCRAEASLKCLHELIRQRIVEIFANPPLPDVEPDRAFALWLCLDRDNARSGLAIARNDHVLALMREIDQLRKLRFGFMHVDGRHGDLLS